MPLQTVFLDAGGVILHPNWVRVSAALEKHGVHVDAPTLRAAEPQAKRRLDAARVVGGTNDASRGWLYFDLILEGARVQASSATAAALTELHDYHSRENLWEYVPPEVPRVLDALRQRGLQLVVVSNANGRLRDVLRRLSIDRYFHHVLDSFEEGVEKPDPRLFQIALKKANAEAATTIHVGDLYEIDVVGARSAGIRGVLLDEGGLYEDADCPRVRSLEDLEKQIASGMFD
jgi:HAD superfamily hydrolase (TIGR01549 family)